MKKVITGLLITWGIVMSACTLMLWADGDNLRRVAHAEADLIDARDEMYKRLFLREAEAIDQLSTEVDLQQKIIETMQSELELKNQTKGKAKGTSL